MHHLPPIQLSFPAVDALLAEFRPSLGTSLPGYRNHVHRVLNYYLALARDAETPPPSVLLAATFHDLGMWTDATFDYLDPSVQIASRHLAAIGQSRLLPEVGALIVEHHKLGRYRGPFAERVEPFRRADWVDVSLGLLRSGLPLGYVRAVQQALPDAGFHAELALRTLDQFGRTPWRPLPMLRY